MKKILFTLLTTTLGLAAFAQKSDGSAKSLANAEVAFNTMAKKSGSNAAFESFFAKDGLVFRPNPVNGKKYFETAAELESFTRIPALTRISRSRDWGFTTGSYSSGNEQKVHGQYASIWRGVDGKWELLLDMTTETNKALQKVDPVIVEPKDRYNPVFASEKELKNSREIILTTEKTLNTTLKTYGPSAFSGFISSNSRLLFPGTDPIVGKEAIQAFNNRMIGKISLKTIAVDKALGGELAYSYGVATIDYQTDLRESFNYLYIWERQADFSWNILVQIYTLADR